MQSYTFQSFCAEGFHAWKVDDATDLAQVYLACDNPKAGRDSDGVNMRLHKKHLEVHILCFAGFTMLPHCTQHCRKCAMVEFLLLLACELETIVMERRSYPRKLSDLHLDPFLPISARVDLFLARDKDRFELVN